MSHSSEEIQHLQASGQHLVFASDADRDNTVQCMKQTFSLNEFGASRIECLRDNKLDREMIGHLVGMLSFNISSLQRENSKLAHLLRESKHQNALTERRVLCLQREVDLHKEKNIQMSGILTQCGFTSAMENFETLQSAMKLIKERNGFEKLHAAVECFSSVECGSDDGLGEATKYSTKYEAEDESDDTAMVESPPSKELNGQCENNHSLQSFPPFPYNQSYSQSNTNSYYTLLAQQQQQQQLDNSTFLQQHVEDT